jgi:hypothetical protein
VCCVVLWEVSLLFLEETVKTGSFWKLVAFFVWVVLCLFLLPRGGWKEGLRRVLAGASAGTYEAGW